MKTGNITKVGVPRAWEGPNGTIYYFNLLLDSETDPCNIGAKDENPDWLQVGKSLEYEVAKKDERNGQTTLKIKRAQKQFTGKSSKGGFGKYDPKAEKARMITMTLSYAKDLCVAGVVKTGDEMLEAHDALLRHAWKYVDELG